jgi:hypothetical protein
MKKITFFLVITLVLFSCATLEKNLNKLVATQGEKPLDEKTIIKGLKEALEIGIKNGVKSASKTDGYYGNISIKILLPKDLEKVAKELKKLGLQKQVDEFVLSMNRAAEKAAPKAVDIFVRAIMEMTFEDAKKILKGKNDEATQYFERKTRLELVALFSPIVKDAMDSVGVTRIFKEILRVYNSIPFIEKVSFDLDRYVVNKALDGLFYLIAVEEGKIRKDPIARVTEILKRVFGSLD